MTILSSMLLSCATPEPPPDPVGMEHAARLVEGTVTVPDCSVLDRCPIEGMDAALCVDDPSVLEIDTMEGAVVDVRLNRTTAALAALPSATWFTVFPDPTGGCSPTLVSFDPEDALQATVDAVEVTP
jgi:hypothetical protein